MSFFQSINRAAAYLFHIISNHPFIDGNKRSGTVAVLTFLEANEIQLEYVEDDLENLVVDVAKGQIKKEEIALFFSKHFTGGIQ